MAKLILRCPYLKGCSGAHLTNYVKYIATREGVDKISHADKTLPATVGQKKLIDRLVKDFPICKTMYEYEDYLQNPTRENASEFITRALEDNYDQLGKRSNYVDYIANRPNVYKMGEHGLFSDTDRSLVLSDIAKEVSSHKGNVWTHIISLRREDASRLGYDNAHQWQRFLRSQRNFIAEQMKINPNNFRWYAAFHNEGHHPHVHMIAYSTNPNEPYLTKQGIQNMRSAFTTELFKQDLVQIYTEQTTARDTLREESENILQGYINSLSNGVCENEEILEKLQLLATRLQNTSGKKQYGYLKADVKLLVNQIVDALSKEPSVSNCYEQWCTLRAEVIDGYHGKPYEKKSLSEEKEFRHIRNLIVREADRLGKNPLSFAEPKSSDDDESVTAEELFAIPLPETEQEHWEKSYPEFVRMEQERADDTLLYRLGKMCQNGQGTDKDLNQAIDYFKKSAEFKNVHAMYALAKLYLREEFPANADDIRKAIEYLHLAAKTNSLASYTLGKIYLTDKSVQNRELAVYWLTLSAEHGNEYAVFLLNHMDDGDVFALFHATSLLRSLASIFESTPYAPPYFSSTDKKMRAKLRQKKQAQGHASDDSLSESYGLN